VFSWSGRHGAEIDLAADQQTKPLAGCNALGLVYALEKSIAETAAIKQGWREEKVALSLQLKTQKCCFFPSPTQHNSFSKAGRRCVFVGKVRGAARTTRCNVLFTVHEWATVIKDNLLYCSKLGRPACERRERKRLGAAAALGRARSPGSCGAALKWPGAHKIFLPPTFMLP
jgi:hypothetical protein